MHAHWDALGLPLIVAHTVEEKRGVQNGGCACYVGCTLTCSAPQSVVCTVLNVSVLWSCVCMRVELAR